MNAREIYEGSDGALTLRFYNQLVRINLAKGTIAMNLFRAQKCSERAKKYHGGVPGKGSYRDMAYERKNWSLKELCRVLVDNPIVNFGWKKDPDTPKFEWVLYVDLPNGQVSFHSAERYSGPDYLGEWDGRRGVSAARIVEYCDALMRPKETLFG